MPAKSDLPEDLITRAGQLPCFTAPGHVEVLGGGKTNHNLLVHDCDRRFVVRFGTDNPEHGILRWNELAVSRAAERAGIAPAIHHAEPGLLVMEFVDARPISPEDRQNPGMIDKLAMLVRRVHHDVMRELEGPVLCFWVFHIIDDYVRLLRDRGSRHRPLLSGLLNDARRLEKALGPTEVVLGHNDLLPGNILIGPGRIWLIDWEYAGFGSPLFDIGGLASNNDFSVAEEQTLLETYYDRPLDDELWRKYSAMKCASLLRETLWSMVSEITSSIDFDYGAYTAQYHSAYQAAYQSFKTL